MKSFGGLRALPQREPFELKYIDAEEEPQAAVFQVVPRASGADIAAILVAAKNKPEDAPGYMIRLLGKVMDNKDGLVKAQWRPDALRAPEANPDTVWPPRPAEHMENPFSTGSSWPDPLYPPNPMDTPNPLPSMQVADAIVATDPAPVEREPSYRGPDGEIYPFSDTAALERWQDHETWTSRRRWKYLIEDDDDAVIEMEDLMAIAEWVIGLATGRPTPPRA